MSLRRVLWILLGCFLGAAARADDPGLEIFFVDVEGGAATLLVGPQRESLLIDSGNPGTRDAQRIHRVATAVAGLKQIDHYVTTHWHMDHYGGIGRLADLMPVAHFYDRGLIDRLPEDPQYFPILMPIYRKISAGKRTQLKPGDQIPFKQTPGGLPLEIRCLSAAGHVLQRDGQPPPAQRCTQHQFKEPDPSDNAQSITLRVQYGPFTFLDCGDLTWNVEHDLVCPHDLIGKIDVFQVTHHGLDVSNNPLLLETIQPRVAVCNNGPRKGAMPAVTRALRNLPGLEAIYQLHRNEAVGAELNTNPALIANATADCKGEFIHLAVARDGKSYGVRIGDRPPRPYQTR